MRGTLRTIGLFILMFLLFGAIGYVVGYFFSDPLVGLGFFIFLAGIMNAVSYFLSDRLVLWSYRARMVDEAQAPNLYRIVRRVATTYNLPMPRVAIIPTMTPNAMATGRNPRRAVVAVTEGITQLLDEGELEGVLGHEMGHVRDRDILVMSVAATLAGAISIAARYLGWGVLWGGGRNRNGNLILLLVVWVTAPLAALLIQLAISRSREYKADYVGATTMRRPNSLADALEKLETWNHRRPMQFGSPAASSLFIVNPFRGGGLVSLFSTHPPIEERVQRLRDLGRELHITT